VEDPRRYWVGWNLVKGIGAVRFRALLNAFGDAQSAWEASPEALREAGLGEKVTANVVKLRQHVLLDVVWEKLQAGDIQVLTWDDDAYPRRLKEIDQPPPVLYLAAVCCPKTNGRWRS
jgi:DNA processing protein